MKDGDGVLALHREGNLLRVELNRPERRNAMSLAMVESLLRVFAEVEADPSLRILLISGRGGHFCAGGDVADMAGAAAEASDGTDPIAALNRRFGDLLQAVEGSRAAVIALCEGAVMGGGFGLACVADLTVALASARFRLPETSLGITPAQIAPFVVRRLGLSQARRLGVTGQVVDGREAVNLGLAHILAEDRAAADAVISHSINDIRRCEPAALAATKRLMNRAAQADLGPTLDAAAAEFAGFARSEAAAQGFAAFLGRQPPPWAREDA